MNKLSNLLVIGSACAHTTCCECGIAQYAAGYILQYANKGVLFNETINDPFLDYQLDYTDNHSAERNGTKE